MFLIFTDMSQQICNWLYIIPGKRLAFLESDILLKNGDKIVVKGAHTKFL